MIYEFQCKACGHKIEVSMSPLKYDDNIVCPACGVWMDRIFTPINFSISNRPYDYGKGMDAEKERQIALERTGGWDG